MRKLFFALVLSVFMIGLSGAAYSIPLGDFLPFGAGAGDSRLAENDDSYTSEITLGTSLTFFGTTYSSLWVNNNGNVTFDSGMSTYTPFAFPGSRVIVAPYFGDVDTGGTGDVAGDGLNDLYYGERTGAGDLLDISDIVNNAFGGTYEATYGFLATWDHVGYYDERTDLLNTFQLALTTDGTDTFAIFNYLDDGMTWETGEASDGIDGFGGEEATAGFDAGNSSDYFTIAGSGAPGIANVLEDGSNVDVAGQWVFQINEGEIIPGPEGDPEVPEPTTMLLLGSGLLGLAGLRRKKRRNI